MQRKTAILSIMAAAMLLSSGPAPADGDLAAGKRVFNKCKACHDIEQKKHKLGPTLAGVIGRTVGTATDNASQRFRYSEAMKQAGANGLVWTPESLDTYLTNPKAFIPNNRMPFPGLKDATDRKNVIAYIQSRMK